MKCICLKGLLFSSFLLALCLTGVSTGYAQDKPVYAPLIEKDTKLIARIDINQIDFSSVTKKVSEVANPFIDALVEKKEERDRAKMSVPLFVGMLTGQYAGVVEALKAAGAQELYIVTGLEEKGMSNTYVAVPVGAKSKDELKKIREAFATFKDMNINLRFPFVRHGFVIVPYIDPAQDDDEAIKTYIKQRFVKLDTVADPGFAKGMDVAKGKTLVIASVLNDNSTKEILSGLSELEQNPMMAQGGDVAKKSAQLGQKFLEKAVKSIAAVTYSFDLKELAYTITLRMKSVADIETLKKEFGSLSDDAVKDTADKDLVEGTKKMMESLTPVTEGDTLNWKIDPAWIAANRDFFIKVIKKVQAEANKAEAAPAPSK
ncbi:MAG: hypothetical protein PHQ75_03630 [Thermoguttaceae bacterium]|nr:hypothetical protein [Thermoguttaceae bacterium]